MSNLNKKNFWNKQYAATPEAMQVFCKWIDVYKAENNWPILFNEGITYSEDERDNNGFWVTTAFETAAPKFHDLPFEMQCGIIARFMKEHQAGLKTPQILAVLNITNIQTTIHSLSTYFEALQQELILNSTDGN